MLVGEEGNGVYILILFLSQGETYYFVEPSLFLFLLEEGHMQEWGELSGHFYGSLGGSVEVRGQLDAESKTLEARAGNIHVCHLRR